MQIRQSLLSAVAVLGERNGDDGRSMRRLTQRRLNSRSRASPAGEDTWVWLPSAIAIDPDARQQKLLLPTVFC
jgi:hypothetical protein